MLRFWWCITIDYMPKVFRNRDFLSKKNTVTVEVRVENWSFFYFTRHGLSLANKLEKAYNDFCFPVVSLVLPSTFFSPSFSPVLFHAFRNLHRLFSRPLTKHSGTACWIVVQSPPHQSVLSICWVFFSAVCSAAKPVKFSVLVWIGFLKFWPEVMIQINVTFPKKEFTVD